MSEKKEATVLTIGHSSHPIERFVALLKQNGVTAVADVRSSPFSRHNPQYNRESLLEALSGAGIVYVFVGKELGARSSDPSCYENGRVQYARLAKTSLFESGIDRVLQGVKKYRIALMCAEKEPLDCHRTLLVSRALESREVSILHILSNGEAEPQSKTMSRLLDMVGLPQEDMFRTREQLIEEACKLREQKVAYVDASQVEQVNP
ncbi:DUF488 family protein [Dyella acidiphila]|uniref:DUF488 domain-containing protein n=1 Tax=Dyella acidiphila TaxID=2775866 RepID=A0ABR9GFG9_9GAMM|nr:DUF488 domain-containing protein [Dyella acidiphila]MBE1162791.1 DUF488 domain-containing protein [Dyella acidiphila]